MTDTFDWESKWIALAPKPFAFLSILGSVCIMRYVLASDQRRRSIYHRLLLGLSVYDFMGSCAVLAGTLAIPKGTPDVFMASGTQGTCSAQGFFIQMGIGTPLYNASLAIYYFFVINLGWNDSLMRKVEVWLHAMPNVIAVLTSIAGATILDTEGNRGLYHNSNLWCWTAPPANPIYRIVFYYMLVWASMVIATLSMGVIYYRVLVTERQMAKGTTTGDSATGVRRSKNKKASSKIASQAMFYVISFYLTFLFASWTRISQMVKGYVEFPVIFLFAIFFPLQGLFNAMVYFRPRFLSYMAANPNMSLRNIVAGIRASVSTKEVGEYVQKAQQSSRVLPLDINITKAARCGVESALNYEEGGLMRGNASKKVYFEDDDPLVEEEGETEEDCENPNHDDLRGENKKKNEES